MRGQWLNDEDTEQLRPPRVPLVVLPMKKAQLEGRAYATLRDFVYEVEKSAGLQMSKAIAKARRDRRAPPSSSEFVFFAQKMAQVQMRESDADVQWVLHGYEEAWYNAKRSDPMA